MIRGSFLSMLGGLCGAGGTLWPLAFEVHQRKGKDSTYPQRGLILPTPEEPSRALVLSCHVSWPSVSYFYLSMMSSSPSLAVIQGAKEALDLGITGPEGIEISRPEEVRKSLWFLSH